MKTYTEHEVRPRALAGCLVGSAVGDALGLPCEGLPPTRQARLFGTITDYRLLRGRGMVSDDTEHALLTTDALIQSAGDGERFARALARGLRRWVLTLPPGVGLATLRAGLRLVVGVSPSRSGVFSAGNGPLMRASILGVAFGDDPERVRTLVHHSSHITHTDPRAAQGALGVALAAHLSAKRQLTAEAFVHVWQGVDLPGDALHVLSTLDSVGRGETTVNFARQIGLANGVSGFVAHTFPIALHAALSFPNDFASSVQSVIACGGDTDTTGAIVGGIVGAGVGVTGIPARWQNGLVEPFLMPTLLQARADQLARVLATGEPGRVRPFPYPLTLGRNLGFLGVVLYHGLRRLLPPY